MGQQSMTQMALTVIMFIIAYLNPAKEKAQFTLKKIIISAHYLKILYLTTVVPLIKVDLFIMNVIMDKLYNNKLAIINQKQKTV